METKVIMSILAGTGLVSYIMGIMLNLVNWKANILFLLGATFMLVKICVFCAKSWQEYRFREWQLKEKAKKK